MAAEKDDSRIVPVHFCRVTVISSHVPGPFSRRRPQGSPDKKARTQVQPLLVGLASLNTVSCPYAQAYIPSKAEAAGRDYKKMRKEPGPANKQ